MSRRAALLTFAVLAAAGIGALLLAAGQDRRPLAFSVDALARDQVAVLSRGGSACESGIDAQAPFRSLVVWPAPVAGPGPALAVTVADNASGRPLATGTVPAGYASPAAELVALSATVPAGGRVRVCLRDAGPGRVTLIGSTLGPAYALRVGRTARHADLAMLFLRPRARSLLSLLPSVFARAALFKLAWMGTWTVWLLALGVLAAFVLAALALRTATRAEQ